MSKPPKQFKIKVTEPDGSTHYHVPGETEKAIGKFLSNLIDAFLGKKR